MNSKQSIRCAMNDAAFSFLHGSNTHLCPVPPPLPPPPPARPFGSFPPSRSSDPESAWQTLPWKSFGRTRDIPFLLVSPKAEVPFVVRGTEPECGGLTQRTHSGPRTHTPRAGAESRTLAFGSGRMSHHRPSIGERTPSVNQS